jgi:hypothetical protein
MELSLHVNYFLLDKLSQLCEVHIVKLSEVSTLVLFVVVDITRQHLLLAVNAVSEILWDFLTYLRFPNAVMFNWRYSERVTFPLSLETHLHLFVTRVV